MSDRYFIDEPISPGRVVLVGPEAHHLIHVMRAAPGMQVVLFDGSGAEFPAVVQQVGRSEVELLALSREQLSRELPVDVTLGVALPKGERQKWLVEKAVELGVTRLVPLRTQRGVARPAEQALVRLRRTVVEASKQCGRNRLMQIDGPQSWPDFVADAADVPCRLLAHPQAESSVRGDSSRRCVEVLPDNRRRESPPTALPAGGAFPDSSALPDRVFLAIGPEGGFAAEEAALAVAAGWHAVDLGPRILRVETAALLLVAMVVKEISSGR